ncbi:flagellar export chaperone FlgN [Grimontia kaedaensis]|uniref:Flagellar export chaperone FlgN n=1 Tax=Grimontia kaedaensis TaxID=2872157 RepID=A0ABY4WX07_9GAMM|nr:flagellar export chaperone FlgN [Grimontia kaedaensis]USH03157.1 flagellar export chaperone FlgN [Grimontia kaedaensis]
MSEALSFEQLLQAQAENVDALLEVMEQETSAIALRKAADIDACAKQKLTIIQNIQLRDAQLAKCPELQSPSEEHLTVISHIKASLENCHQVNEANGVALQRAQLSMHKLRNLFQEAAGNSEMTYDSEGQASGSRTLGTNVKA